MNQLTKKQWEKGKRICEKCDRIRDAKKMHRMKSPSDYLGEPHFWICHEVEVYTKQGKRYYCEP